jgi:membrane-associated phospholipid phosphatase
VETRVTLPTDEGDDRLTAVDVLNIATILLLTMLVAFLRRDLGDAAAWLAALFTSLLVFLLLAAFLAERRPSWRLAHDFSPVLVIPVLFNAIGPLISQANPSRWDATFAAVDRRCFGTLADMWRGFLGRPPWFTDLASVAYCGYYLAPVVLAVIFYRRAPRGEFRTLVFTMVLTFYAAYLGYFLFPTLGPRPAPGAEAAVIGGGAVSHAIRAFINFVERNRTDAFPSGHTAGALICLYFARRAGRLVFALFVPVAAGITFSTVYLHYHYVIDDVAGVALAGACAWLGPRLEPLLEPAAVARRLSVRLGLR